MPLPERINRLILKVNPDATHLDLSSCGLGDEHLEEIADFLLKNKSIISINLRRNNLSDDAMRFLEQCPHLQEIDLNQNNVDINGVKSLLKITSLRRLILTNNFLRKEAAELLLSRCGPGFYVAVAGNKRVDRDLVDAIRKKCCGENAISDAENKLKTTSVANHPSTQYGKHIEKSRDGDSLDQHHNGDLKQNGHKK